MRHHVNRETDIHFPERADKHRKMKKLQGVGAVLSAVLTVIYRLKKRIVRGDREDEEKGPCHETCHEKGQCHKKRPCHK